MIDLLKAERVHALLASTWWSSGIARHRRSQVNKTLPDIRG